MTCFERCELRNNSIHAMRNTKVVVCGVRAVWFAQGSGTFGNEIYSSHSRKQFKKTVGRVCPGVHHSLFFALDFLSCIMASSALAIKKERMQSQAQHSDLSFFLSTVGSETKQLLPIVTSCFLPLFCAAIHHSGPLLHFSIFPSSLCIFRLSE